VDRVDEEDVGAERLVLAVDADGPRALDVVRRHHRVDGDRQAVLAREGELPLPDLRLGVLDTAAGDPEVQQAVARALEALATHAQDVVEVDRLGPLREGAPRLRVAGRAVREAPAHARLGHRLQGGVGVRGCLEVVLPGVHRGDAGVDGLGESEADRGVGVVGREVRAVGEDDIVKVGREVAVARAAAQHRRPHMAVGVDEAGHDDPAAGVEHLVGVAREVGPHRLDPCPVEQDVAARQRPEVVVHREDEGVRDERAGHALGSPLR
jgi:hypothetical protein